MPHKKQLPDFYLTYTWIFKNIFVYLEHNSSIKHIMSRYATSEMKKKQHSFLILKSNTLQSLMASWKPIAWNPNTYNTFINLFIVAKRYCRWIFFNIKIRIVINLAHCYLLSKTLQLLQQQFYCPMHPTVKRDTDVISDIVSYDNTRLDSEWIPPTTSQGCKPLSLLLFFTCCYLYTRY